MSETPQLNLEPRAQATSLQETWVACIQNGHLEAGVGLKDPISYSLEIPENFELCKVVHNLNECERPRYVRVQGC
jgi:hypothetical protein